MAATSNYPMTKSQPENITQKNPIGVGICSLEELEERLRAFRSMNPMCIKKRYILSRENIINPNTKAVILKKSAEIDIPAIKLVRRYYSSETQIKIFQPDEGIAIISNMSNPQGISFSMDLVTQVLNIGGGVYEGFIERVDSFGELLNLLKKVLFPRILIIGYLPDEHKNMEKINFLRAKRIDQFVRIIEVTHGLHKKNLYFPKVNQVHIDPDDPHAWSHLVLRIINEYTKPYMVENV